mmetsp:Transcript_101519/g.293800  ORF Transcript_101519/g.293800 Transcript_101519/m.293800 type:complete len:262 (-) Transcript_101519:350-1135(-)
MRQIKMLRNHTVSARQATAPTALSRWRRISRDKYTEAKGMSTVLKTIATIKTTSHIRRPWLYGFSISLRNLSRRLSWLTFAQEANVPKRSIVRAPGLLKPRNSTSERRSGTLKTESAASSLSSVTNANRTCVSRESDDRISIAAGRRLGGVSLGVRVDKLPMIENRRRGGAAKFELSMDTRRDDGGAEHKEALVASGDAMVDAGSPKPMQPPTSIEDVVDHTRCGCDNAAAPGKKWLFVLVRLDGVSIQLESEPLLDPGCG